jgi:hypothetical protein
VILIHRCVQQKPLRRAWTEEEIDQVRELLVANPVDVVARKMGRSPSSGKHLCSRRGIRINELRCDLFSISSLAPAMHVRKAEIVFWIDQGWLEVTKEGQGRIVAYLISPEAPQRCLREHLQDLQKRNIRSSTILAVFNGTSFAWKSSGQRIEDAGLVELHSPVHSNIERELLLHGQTSLVMALDLRSQRQSCAGAHRPADGANSPLDFQLRTTQRGAAPFRR